MAGLCSGVPFSVALTSRSPSNLQRFHGIRCCSGVPENKSNSYVSETPQFLKLAVTGVTELLRVFSRFIDSNERLDDDDAVGVESVDDVLNVLKSDYEKDYFVTGIFTSAIYAEDCIFEDPTIRFRGKELYSGNLKLLGPFFEQPSIGLQKIEKVQGMYSETNCILAKWKLRTYLKLPWRPFISIDGNTIYELDNEFKIIRHTESWDVSALQAVGQIFNPSYGKPSDGL